MRKKTDTKIFDIRILPAYKWYKRLDESNMCSSIIMAPLYNMFQQSQCSSTKLIV